LYFNPNRRIKIIALEGRKAPAFGEPSAAQASASNPAHTKEVGTLPLGAFRVNAIPFVAW